jgi:hypothetical protein
MNISGQWNIREDRKGCETSDDGKDEDREWRLIDKEGELTLQTFRFVNHKSESLFLQRKNPRKLAWTQVYRRCVIWIKGGGL